MTTILAGSQVSPSGDPGPLPPAAVSADTGNIATLGSDNLILVPQQTIWYQRLRSFNALGNPTFEIDAKTAGAGTSTAGNFALDRWIRGGNLAASAVQNPVAVGNVVSVPNTNFGITSKYLRVTLTTQKPTLAATDSLLIYQHVEGPRLRELINDVHSVSILCRGPANLSFGLWIRDSGQAYTLTLLCTLGSNPNLWYLITLPNLAIWTPSGTFPLTPGSNGYDWGICLAAGSSQTATANGVWNSSGGFFGALGQSNFAAQPVNTPFDLAYVGHEPGPLCTTPQDLDYATNRDLCLRYFTKTWPDNTAIGTSGDAGSIAAACPASSSWQPAGVRFPKPMAKAPTVTIYGRNGTVNTIGYVMGAGAAKAITPPPVGISESGYSYISFTAAIPAVNDWGIWHHTADTGW